MSTVFEIAPGYEASLKKAGLTDFDAMLKARGHDPLSVHAHRETLPIDLDVDGETRRFYLKRVFKVPPKHAFWPLFRLRIGQSQPLQEWSILKELEEAGIPAMRRVAVGERRRCGMPAQAFLLIESVPMPHTLEDWLVPGFPKPASMPEGGRSALLRELGVLVARLATGGFDWPDIHAKHIYAEPVGEGTEGAEGVIEQWRFALIDVERMTRQVGGDEEKLRFRLNRRLLGSLAPMPLAREDISRLMPEDHHKIKPLPEQPRLPDAWEHPRVVPLRKVGRIVVDERFAPMLQEMGLARFEDIFRFEGGERMGKPGLASYRDRIRLSRTTDAGQTQAFYLKRFDHPPLAEQLRRIRECGVKSSSGWREMHFVKVLSLLGIPTMRGVAFGQRMKRLFEKRSFGITEEIQGESLERLAIRASEDPAAVPAWPDRREIIIQLARIARLMHAYKLFHRDFYLCHVFLTRNVDGGIVLRLIDLGRMIQKPRNPKRWAVKDLAALEYSSPSPLVTRADRVRFLYHYMPDSKGSHAAVRSCIAAVRQRVERMARHDAHRMERFRREGKA